MGMYLNPGAGLLRQARKSKIYIDKSELIAILNDSFFTEQKYLCISRPRRFGKSMAANMISAYYDRTVNQQEAFKGLKITEDKSFGEYAGQCDVLKINMQNFLSTSKDIDDLLKILQEFPAHELLKAYPDVDYLNEGNLPLCMEQIYVETGRHFVIIIDEWDCVMREHQGDLDAQKKYLDFLRTWLKDREYVGLAYMTGILPIKKYGTHSALNMFREFSMTSPGDLAPFFGFTEQEVQGLCETWGRDFETCKTWYDGYQLPIAGSLYNPRSVVEAMTSGFFDTYWNKTETVDALTKYITLNFDGLRDAVIALMAGDRKEINALKFANDMTSFKNADDVLTLLVHLGYLGYDWYSKEVFIPNQEIQQEYRNSMEDGGWEEIVKSIKASDELLKATLKGDEDAVAQGLENAHFETSHLQYNDENALSYTVSLAYYSARQMYLVQREMPAGKGFADLVFLPRPRHLDKPALLIELKWDKDAKTALDQIRERQYVKALDGYTGEILLVGASYDTKSKKHTCRIEKMTVK